MQTINLLNYLEEQFPSIDFYNNTIDKNNNRCVGIYLGSNLPSYIALGGLDNTSFNYKSFTLLIHWTENSSLCEDVSTSIYNSLKGKSNIIMDGINVRNVDLLDSGPINVSRDENNICEMVIRLNITYNNKEVIEDED